MILDESWNWVYLFYPYWSFSSLLSQQKNFRTFLLRLPFHVKHCIGSICTRTVCSTCTISIVLIPFSWYFLVVKKFLVFSKMTHSTFYNFSCFYILSFAKMHIWINFNPFQFLESVLYLVIWKWYSNKGKICYRLVVVLHCTLFHKKGWYYGLLLRSILVFKNIDCK